MCLMNVRRIELTNLVLSKSILMTDISSDEVLNLNTTFTVELDLK